MRDLTQKRLDGRTIANVGILRLEEDEVLLPNGVQVKRAAIRKASAVVIVPLTAAGKVVLVRQYRYPVGKALLELPAGGFESGESPEAVAIRELQEEAGYKPGRLVLLNTSYPVPGYCDERFYFYLALDLTPSKLPGDVDEDIEICELELEGALHDPLLSEDGKSLLGLFLAREYLSRQSLE